MAKYEKTVVGDFNAIVHELDKAIMGSGVSMKLVDENTYMTGEIQIVVRVYDKYFMRNSSRASLSLTVVGNDESVYISAIGAGGSQGVIFDFSWGAESELVDIVSECLNQMGL